MDQQVNTVAPQRSGSTYISQAPFEGTVPPVTQGTMCVTIFSQDSIKQLDAHDFSLDNVEKVGLKYDDCMIVLFYGENTESKQLIKIFSIVAQQTLGPIMAACNLVIERKVAKAFVDIKGKGSHPLHWTSIRGYPFMLVYRNGFPTAFYNGDRSVESILDWTMTLACQANYYERVNLAGGVQAESAYQMTPVARYPSDGNEIRTKSYDYNTGRPIRGFNPNLPITYQGSSEAQEEVQLQDNVSIPGQQSNI